MKIELWAPTEYWFSLPKIRKELSEPFLREWTILDYWCWNWANTVLFNDPKRKIVWIDVEELRVDEAVLYAQKNHLNISYMVYWWDHLPFDNNAFANVISYEVLEHTENDFLAVREVYRVLEPWWHFIVTIPNKWYLFETHGFRWWISQLISTNRIPFLSWLPTKIHERFANARIYSRSRALALFESAWFQVVHHSYIMPPLDKITIKRIKNILLWWISLLRLLRLDCLWVAHFIVCKK